jgi:putative oxidoreductase
MAFAYFTEHQPKGLWPIQNGGELAVLYCFALLLIVFAGAGAFAVGRSRPLP